MEQPRFGGVALPPFSVPRDGEGKSPESVTNTMEPTQLTTLDLQCVIPEGHSDDVGGGADPDVQKVMEVLRQLGISPRLERHKLKHERQRTVEARTAGDGVYCKNLLLKDKKGQVYLIICGENDTADLHVVKYHLNTQGNLHFASKESMWNLLRVLPGAVSPLALIHSRGDVRVFIDAALVKTIDPDLTKLYLHPLRAELQVGLTLSELETFLRHCDISLEMLPSLTSYSARRRYNNLTGGCRYKPKPEHKFRTEIKDAEEQEALSEETGADSLQQPENRDGVVDQADNTFTQYSDLFQQLGVSVQIVPAKEKENASNRTLLPCRSVYLKDKRDNYFLFICHKNQKVDFSTLKAQLKPRKKIVPLDREELWSVLHLHENQEHPFVLAQMKQPRFLVAISDNLHCKGNTVLAFPHPTDPSLHLEIALKHLETFITNTSHDLITIQMKGNIEQLQAISASPACSSSSEEAQLNKPAHHSEAESECTPSLHPVDESHCQHLPSQRMAPPFSPAEQGNNLFYQLTAPLREWIWRCIRSFVQLLNHYLPNQVSAMLSRSLSWNRILASGNNNTPDCITQNEEEEHANGPTSGENQKMAKIAKLQQLIEQSGIQVDLTEIYPLARFLKDDAERCKTGLLEDGLGQPFIVLCTEEDDTSRRNLRRLRTAFRSRGALHVANDAGVSHHLSWPEDPTVSWTQEDLNPVALIDMDLHALERRVRIGMTGALYSFPGTTLNFDLPPLGVALRMSCDDMEKMLKRLGFYVVYLP